VVEDCIAEVLGIWMKGDPPYENRRSRATRSNFGKLFAKLNYTKGAEIGVADGSFSKLLCGCNPNLHLFCVDSWQQYYTWNREKQDIWNEEKQQTNYSETLKNLDSCNTTVIRKSSVDASKEFEKESLDFVYIDAAHDFDNVMLDLIHWVPKVRKGGIVSGHDYVNYNPGQRLTANADTFQVVLALNAYLKAHDNNPLFITRLDHVPSWLFVK
jgi:hypothetical protein